MFSILGFVSFLLKFTHLARGATPKLSFCGAAYKFKSTRLARGATSIVFNRDGIVSI